MNFFDLFGFSKFYYQIPLDICLLFLYTDTILINKFCLLIKGTDKMVFTDTTWKYFSLAQSYIRAAKAESTTSIPFEYNNEPFFKSYNALYEVWKKRISKRTVAHALNVGRDTLLKWEVEFMNHGAIGLLPNLSQIQIDPKLEKLIVLVKSSRPHERANYTLKLANALNISGATLDIIRRTQRCHGYGQRLDERDIEFYSGLQHILVSVEKHKKKKLNFHDSKNRKDGFFNFDKDFFQQRIELIKTLSQCSKNRQIRPILKEYGINPNRFYYLKNRYLSYGVWGLVDLIQKGQVGEKISPDVEVQIIEEKLMYP